MQKITVVGAINIDIEGRPNNKLIEQDSNIGHVTIAHGGVGRNITENLARLGADCAMLSLIGDDEMGKGAKDELEKLGVDVSRIFTSRTHGSSIYLCVLDDQGDMSIGINDMAIVDEITPEFLKENEDFLLKSDIIALDGNLTGELLDFATEMLGTKKLFYDPVSVNKCVRAKDFIGRFYAIKPNVMEAEALLDMKIETEEDVKNAAKAFLDKGVRKVFITLNKDGVFFMDEASSGFLRPEKNLKIVSATGAGDAFSSCVLYGMANDYEIEKIAKLGMNASKVAMESSHAVNKEMSLKRIEG